MTAIMTPMTVVMTTTTTTTATTTGVMDLTGLVLGAESSVVVSKLKEKKTLQL